MHGLLILNKPVGMTSRAAVDVVQGWFPGVRVGHAGTLDPAASGTLVLGLGDATRLLEYVQRMPKTYRAAVRLGAVSDTDDAEGRVQIRDGASPPSRQALQACLAQFQGEIEQVPPAHSAAHVEGQRAYRLARRGKEVSLAPRRVWIHRIELVHYVYPRVELVVQCGKGAYIRSLARDVGNCLGCGGMLEALERSRIGPFLLQDALMLNAGSDQARRQVRPAAQAVVELPQAALSAIDLKRLTHGQRVILQDSHLFGWNDGSEIAVIGQHNEVFAIARFAAAEGALWPEKVIARVACEKPAATEETMHGRGCSGDSVGIA
jgi:tRNA pseudouridine55 synthase